MKTVLVAPGLVIVLIAAGAACARVPAETTTASDSSEIASSGSLGQPITVISVLDNYKAGQTVNPGGPSTEITLKNVSAEDVVSLAVALEERGKEFNFDFDLTRSHALAPGRTISARQILIGGGWGPDISYSVAISGTLRSGAAFSFTWEPKS